MTKGDIKESIEPFILSNNQYYWKGMNKDICKYMNNCVLCKREKARTQVYYLQMTDIPNRTFDKIATDLESDLNVSASGNQHIPTIIDHLTGWPEAFPILTRMQTPLSTSSSIITYLFTCAPTSYYQTMAQN